MKELIIIIGTLILGAIIFNMLVGDEGSLKEASRESMIHSTLIYEQEYQ